MGRQGHSRAGGVTLIELLVLLAIVAILQTLAAPAMSGFADSLRLTAGINSLLSSLHLARSEAIKRNGRVVLCKSPTGVSCVASGAWEQGWIVFHDANNNATLEPGETVIQQEGSMPASFRLAGNLNVAKYVSYSATGSAKLVTGAFQAGTLTLCRQSATPAQARTIVISSAGRPRTSRVTVNQCL